MQQSSQPLDSEEVMVLATRIISDFDHIDTELKSFLKTETQQRRFLEQQTKPLFVSPHSESKSKGRSTASSSDSKGKHQKAAKSGRVTSAHNFTNNVIARETGNSSQQIPFDAAKSHKRLQELIKQKYAQINFSIEPIKENTEPTSNTSQDNNPLMAKPYNYHLPTKARKSPPGHEKHIKESPNNATNFSAKHFFSASPKTNIQERSRQGSLSNQSKAAKEGAHVSKVYKEQQ